MKPSQFKTNLKLKGKKLELLICLIYFTDSKS